MARRFESALDRPSGRDAALLRDVLRSLGAQLESHDGHEAAPAPPTPEVEDLVAQAVAELHRVQGDPGPLGGVAPVLGAGVVQELLRVRRESGASALRPETPGGHVDIKR